MELLKKNQKTKQNKNQNLNYSTCGLPQFLFL